MDWRRALLGNRVGETFAGELSASDPRLAELLKVGWFDIGTGLPNVTEAMALGIPSYSRSEEIIVGTLAGLPLKAYEKHDDGSRDEVVSVLDSPQGPSSMSAHEWRTTLYTHCFRYREAYLKPITTADGARIGIELIHPQAVLKVVGNGWGKTYTVRMADKTQRDYTSEEIRQVIVPPFSGSIRGAPIYEYSKPTFQLAIAAMTGMGHVFTGPMVSGLVTPAQDEEVPETEVPTIMTSLQARMSGSDKAGQLAFVNRRLDIKPWRMTNLDAQFAETLAKADEAMATLTGVPPHLLAQLEKQTSWGTGVAEQNLGLNRYTLKQYSDPVESALRWFLAPGQYAETNYKGLLAGTPAEETHLVIDQVAAGIMSPEYAATLLQLPPPPKAAPVPQEVPDGV